MRGEMSPSEAVEWGSSLESVPEHHREALCAWVRSGDYVAEGTGDLPSMLDFEDSYCGEWESFREYAEGLTGLLSGVPDDVARYFDWAAWTRDLAFDYTVEDAPGDGVFVFRNL
ncbi:antirestriction protein ArdA [Glutamicibacter sp. V16R2B1]|uniref:antirestriction protein ArdA n=1 Tax=Glutamicibacter sp. V16R2B1 TaxID=2036207 RepID=UPI0024B493D7|nr:antirestriction protein ArdA [Glutamicibacter sp. V16R2B1]